MYRRHPAGAPYFILALVALSFVRLSTGPHPIIYRTTPDAMPAASALARLGIWLPPEGVSASDLMCGDIRRASPCRRPAV